MKKKLSLLMMLLAVFLGACNSPPKQKEQEPTTQQKPSTQEEIPKLVLKEIDIKSEQGKELLVSDLVENHQDFKEIKIEEFDPMKLGKQIIKVVAVVDESHKINSTMTVEVVEKETVAAVTPSTSEKSEGTEVETSKEEPKESEEPKDETKPAPTPQPKPQPEPKPQPKPEPKPQPQPEPKPQPKPVITTKKVTKTETIAFTTKRIDDATLEKGKEVVKTDGVAGVRTIVTEITYTDGKQTSSKVISNTVTKQPVDKVILVGAKTTTASNICPNGNEKLDPAKPCNYLFRNPDPKAYSPNRTFNTQKEVWDWAEDQMMNGDMMDKGYIRFVALECFVNDGTTLWVVNFYK